MKIAVVGGGITGLGAAWLLSEKHDVTVFEALHRLGGHANTVEADGIAIDTGFIVYNLASYPNLVALFDRLNVPTAPTDMGFAVSFGAGRYEYCGSGLGGLIGQVRNTFSPGHLALMRDVFRFFREAREDTAKTLGFDVSLGDWLTARGYSRRFIHGHIVPMAAAIWSTPASEVLAFPFASFARFFDNHGLLQAYDRPPWRTVLGGSRTYVSKLAAASKARFETSRPVVHVARAGAGVHLILADGSDAAFDAVLIAAPGDQALEMTRGVDDAVSRVLSAFRYTDNTAVLHSDARVMPRRKRLWSSWNYVTDRPVEGPGSATDSDESLSVSYWMNQLQPLPTPKNYFVTLNPSQPIVEKAVHYRTQYRHPLFDRAAMEAQKTLWPLQGRNNIWYAGSYLGYGFHEDGLQAGLAAAEDMSLRLAEGRGRVQRPWPFDVATGRIPIAVDVEPLVEKVPA